MKYKIVYIVAVLVILNIVFIPFLCNKFWSIEDGDISKNAYSFMDMIDDLSDDFSDNDMQLVILYYIVCPICALVIFISALGKHSGACTVGSVGGIILLLYLFYQIYLGTTRWYIGLHDAHLTFGYYISCAGFVTMLIASLNKEHG